MAATVVVQVVTDFVSLALLATLISPSTRPLLPWSSPVTTPAAHGAAMVATLALGDGTPPPGDSFDDWRPAGATRPSTRRCACSDRGLWPWGCCWACSPSSSALPRSTSPAWPSASSGAARSAPAGVYAMMQLLGGLSPLPQGLGVAEGTGTALLSYLGVAVPGPGHYPRLSPLPLACRPLGMLAFLLLRLTEADRCSCRA